MDFFFPWRFFFVPDSQRKKAIKKGEPSSKRLSRRISDKHYYSGLRLQRMLLTGGNPGYRSHNGRPFCRLASKLWFHLF